MKRIIRNNRIIAIAFLTMFSVAATTTVSAGENPGLPVELKYAGKMNDQPVFQLSVNGNALHNDFTVVILDQYNNILYWENIKAETFTKKFLLNTDEIGDEKLRFEIISRKAKQSVSYEVSRSTKTVEEMLVSESTK